MIRKYTLSSLLLIPILLIGYPWPLKNTQGNFNGPLPVSAVLGDYRGSQTEPRFHRGIDISKTGAVFSIVSGQMPDYDPQNPPTELQIGFYRYVHVNPVLGPNLPVTGILDDPNNPTLIANVRTQEGHLHCQTGLADGPFFNPLAYLGGPDNYDDDGMPIVFSVDFWRQGSETNQQQLQSPLWSKIDIRAYCQDRQTVGWPQPTATGGIYKLSCLIRNINNNIVYGRPFAVAFPQVEPPNNGNPVCYIYDVFHSVPAQSPFYYWATNFLDLETHSVTDEWWNTKVRQNENWDGLDARINSEAYFPDGNYRIWVMAYDVLNNGGDTLKRLGAEDEDVAVDNFVPYVKRVQIDQQDKTVKYQIHWSETPQSDYDLGQLIIDADNYCSAGKLLTFFVEFSEDMQTTTLLMLRVQMPDGTIKIVPNGFWVSNRAYQAITGNDFIPAGTSGRATLQISNAQDLTDNSNDGNPRTIAYRDATGDWRQAEAPPDCNYQFWIEAPPQVIATDPADGAQGVDIFKKIKLVFNKSMDTVSVREALTVARLNPPEECLILSCSWDSEAKILDAMVHDPIVADSGFEFDEDYTVMISGQIARDTAGVFLDGDEDGHPGGNKVFTFKTRQPQFTLWVNPPVQRATLSGGIPYASAGFWIMIRNYEQRSLPIEYWVSGGGYGWYVSHMQADTFFVGAQSIDSAAFGVERTIPEPGALGMTAYGKSFEIAHTGAACFWVAEREQQYSEPHPPPSQGVDENYSISSPSFPSPWILNPYAKVGIFLSGYAECVGHLLGKYRIPTCIVLNDFKILGTDARSLSDLDVLIIPTGGLIPYADMPYYREAFKEYVEQGGMLVCFTQSRGEIFEALPGSPSGYGWSQDQSCHAWACYLNYWDTFMSGQNDIVYDGNIDGYVTEYPDSAELYLIRLANGYPSFIRYPFGQGQVVLTTGYTDFAYRFSGGFKDEMALIRDLITAEIVPDSVAEYYKNENVSFNVPIFYPAYEDSIPADRAKIVTYYPNRRTLKSDEITLSQPMVPGDTQII